MENENQKKLIYSAIQPSGMLTLGNYLGALRNWVRLQEEYDCIYTVADLHAITVRQQTAAFRKQILETYALLIAVGVDPRKKSAVYTVPRSGTQPAFLDSFMLYPVRRAVPYDPVQGQIGKACRQC